jgi:hypothetical protein
MDLILFLSLFLFILTYLIHAELYFRKLKQLAPKTFSEIGEPSLLRRRQNVLPILRFFVSGEFRKVKNVSLVQMGKRLVLHFFLSLAAMIGFVGYMLVFGDFSG